MKVENKLIKKSKGVNKSTVSKLKFEDYVSTLFNKSTLKGEMFRIRSISHKVYTHRINKIILNCNDDKRYILDDNVNILAWGNYRIE